MDTFEIQHLDASPGLADRLRARTKALHTRAERSGFVAELLAGRATQARYALYLANLLPAYVALEHGLRQHSGSHSVGALANTRVYRAAAIESDLNAIAGLRWRSRIPVLAEAERYAHRISDVARDGGERLIAHAYARYLGDLNGGQILMHRVGRSLKLGDESLRFYEFAETPDLEALRVAYRGAIDRAAGALTNINAVVEEAARAFELNIEVSQAVANAELPIA